MKRKYVILLLLAVIILFTLIQFLCACLSAWPICPEGYESSVSEYKSYWFCLINCSTSTCVPVG